MTVRNVPDGVRDELAARAVRAGMSLQEFMLAQLVALASRPQAADVIARARRRVRVTGSTASVGDILAARDADRS